MLERPLLVVAASELEEVVLELVLLLEEPLAPAALTMNSAPPEISEPMV